MENGRHQKFEDMEWARLKGRKAGPGKMQTTEVQTKHKAIAHKGKLQANCKERSKEQRDLKTMDAERAAAVPYYLQDMVLFGISLRMSKASFTIMAGTFSLIFYFLFYQQSSATASHILIDDHKAESLAKLTEAKEKINNDPEKFAQYAREISKCPSGKASGGNLGSFGPGAMVPSFDKVIFDPKNNVGVVYGPVQTHFGYHLILIHKRRLN